MDEENVYITKKSINEWRKIVEHRSTLECLSLAELPKNATLKEMQKAMGKDRQFFYGFINEIENVL